MKKRTGWILLAILCIVSLSLFAHPTISLADVGGGVDWGTDNWGGGGGGGGGFDFGNDGWTGGSGGGNFFGFIPFFGGETGFLVLLVLIFLFRAFRKRNQGDSSYRASRSYRPVNDFARDKNLEQLMERDPRFSKEAFLTRSGDVFVSLQKAWSQKNWRAIRAFETDNLFHQHEAQLQEYIDAGQTNKVEDIAILSMEFEEYQEDTSNQLASVILQARYRDYLVDDRSGEVIKGNPEVRYLMTYRMTFQRNLSAKTDPNMEGHVTKCPNCGANLSINQNGVCEYCGSEVSSGNFQWLLLKLQPLSQQRL